MSSTAAGDTWTDHRPKLQRGLSSEGHICVSLDCMTFSFCYSIFWVPHYCKPWTFNLIQKVGAWHFVLKVFNVHVGSTEYVRTWFLNIQPLTCKQEAAAEGFFSISKPQLLIMRPEGKLKKFSHAILISDSTHFDRNDGIPTIHFVG